MKITILTEDIIKKKIPKNFLSGHDLVIIDIEKNRLKSLKPTGLVILLTKRIFSRENNKYKKMIAFLKEKNIKLIEISFEKSELESTKSYSNAIIHGFENMTLEIVSKIIKNYNNCL